MQHSVIMPFSRPKHFRTLREGMEGQGVIWMPLYDSDECHELFTARGPDAGGSLIHKGIAVRTGPLPDWIKPWRGDLPKEKYTETVLDIDNCHQVQKERPTVNPGHWMCDAFFDEQLKQEEADRRYEHKEKDRFFRPDHYVSFMTDDCFWNWNYWRKLQRHFVKRGPQGQEYGPAVVMSASMLGGNVVYAAHRRPNELFHVSTCRTFATRFECLTVRADLLREPRFGSFWAGDGIMVERLVEEHVGEMPETVAFANEAMVFFNALKPEVWGFPASHMP